MSLKRVNITIDESLHKRVHDNGLNLSAMVREMLEDRFSENVIHISVSHETWLKYYKLMDYLQGDDSDFEPYFNEALENYVSDFRETRDNEINKLLGKNAKKKARSRK